MLRTLCILLLFSFPVFGQVPSVPSSPPTSVIPSATSSNQYTAADTVAALHRMFRTRRAGGSTLIGLGVIAQLASPILGAQLSNCCGSYVGLIGFQKGFLVGFGIGLPLTILGGNILANHSNKTEKTAIALYQETHILSSKLEKKLVLGQFLSLK